MGEIEPAKLSRWHPRWRIVALGTEALQKTSFVFSAGLRAIKWGQKDSGVAFLECPALHSKKRMGPDPNPFDFAIWSFLENKVSATYHQNLAEVPQKVICVSDM